MASCKFACACFFPAPNDKRLNSKLFHVWYQNVMKTHTDTQKKLFVWIDCVLGIDFLKKVLPNSSFFAPYDRIQYHHLNRIEFFSLFECESAHRCLYRKPILRCSFAVYRAAFGPSIPYQSSWPSNLIRPKNLWIF